MENKFKEGDMVAYKSHPNICIGRIASYETIYILENNPFYRVFTSDDWFKYFGKYGGPNTLEVEEDDMVLYEPENGGKVNMEKTIEERAEEAFSMPEQPCLEAGIRDVMIKFAKEQKKIDIENACEWLYKNCSGTTECQLAYGRKIVPYNEFVEQFRKAMDEK